MAKHRAKLTGCLIQRTPGAGVYTALWHDHTGRRRSTSTRTSDKRAAEQVLQKLITGAALRHHGVIDALQDKIITARKTVLAKHVDAYLTECRAAGLAGHHIAQKASHLRKFLEATGATLLADLTAEALIAHIGSFRRRGRSARTQNFVREILATFGAWCVETQRLPRNPFERVPVQNVERDRRRIRRALTDDELARLVLAAGDRSVWYLCAVLAGLRRGDLKSIKWADIDFAGGSITIRDGKAKRTDVIALHPQLAEALLAWRGKGGALPAPSARVFPRVVQTLTQQKDFLRAGLARWETVLDAKGEPVMVPFGKAVKGKHRLVPKQRITMTDENGKSIDLHALRTTLGTRLARKVKPQVAMQVMRHRDIRTTLKHYTALELADHAQAIEAAGGVEVTRRSDDQASRAGA